MILPNEAVTPTSVTLKNYNLGKQWVLSIEFPAQYDMSWFQLIPTVAELAVGQDVSESVSSPVFGDRESDSAVNVVAIELVQAIVWVVQGAISQNSLYFSANGGYLADPSGAVLLMDVTPLLVGVVYVGKIMDS